MEKGIFDMNNKIKLNFRGIILLFAILLIIFNIPIVVAYNNSDFKLTTHITYVNDIYKINNNNQVRINTLSTCYIVDSSLIAYGTQSYVINPINQNGLSEDFIINTVSTSAETWDAATTKEVFNPYTIDRNAFPTIYDNPLRDNNRIAFGDLSYFNNVDGSVYIAVVTNYWIYVATGEIAQWDMIINKDLNWGDATINFNVYDLQSVVTHEFGHTFGLSDLYNSQCSQETMYGYGSMNDIRQRTLNDGDITGLQIIYPSTPEIKYGTISGTVTSHWW